MIGANSQFKTFPANVENPYEVSLQVLPKTEPDASSLGHYYRSCPRNKLQAQEKRLMEKTLLSKVGPKEKEHQRKKILRNFFAWNAKQIRTDPTEIKFWNWIKSLNPDNVYSDERFKSMSYEFLDRLLSKPSFRETIDHWLVIYESTLALNEEDEKTRHFISFIRNCISIKDAVLLKKNNFIAENGIEIHFEEPNTSARPKLSQKQLENNGCYFEVKCSNPPCPIFKAKEFVYIGNNFTFEYLSEAQTCFCRECRAPVSAFNVSFLSCKWAFKGNTTDGVYIENPADICTGFASLDEIKLHSWQWLQIKSVDLTPEENEFISGLVVGSFQDPTVPKKKYKKRKEPAVSLKVECKEIEKDEECEVKPSCKMVSVFVQTIEEVVDPTVLLKMQLKKDLDMIKKQIVDIAFNTYKNEQTIACLKEEYQRLVKNGQSKDVEQ
ncbi:unnamed protein product [Blepharisma stoltei]|uniref:Uncharacterized protein n=1 Tax=Blepharisma stoltei TaxID=1481888 RepID=A0AAU9K9C4_9CILI|nr:unnamed protein product [Blepharisma stoltei]